MSTIRIPGIKNEDREDNSKVAAALSSSSSSSSSSTEDIHCHRCGRKIFTGTCGIPGSDDRIFEGDAGCFPFEGGESCGYPCPGGQLFLSAHLNIKS
ncbi:MAG: hypothetical protein GY749_19905 [Desulfobacteraceae bacterium]|nr:hypothetical protein [Desulfobacteraceae bacterium]